MKRATKKTGRTFRTNVKDEEQRQELKRIGRHPLKKSPRGQTVEIRLKPDLYKRPYGLLEGAGISSYGLTPREAWGEWNAYRRDVAAMKREEKEESPKTAPAKATAAKAGKRKPKVRAKAKGTGRKLTAPASAVKVKPAKEKYPKGTVGYEVLHGPIEARERYMKTLSPADRAEMQKELDKQKQTPAKAKKPAGKKKTVASGTKKNVIKRTDGVLRIKLKRDFPFGKAGDTITVRKGNNGWTGNGYYWPSDFLRKGDLCEVVKRERDKDK